MYAIVAGGGKVGFHLARELIDQGEEVLIIENNGERATFIENELGNVVLRGNADEASTLGEAGAARADVVIAVTGDDGDNLVICQVAKKRFGTHRTVALINNPHNENIFKLLGIDATLNATQMMLSILEQEIPHAHMVPLLRLRNSDVEVVEAVVAEGSAADGHSIAQLDLPRDAAIPIVVRDGASIFATPDTRLRVGDTVIALTRSDVEPRLRPLFNA